MSGRNLRKLKRKLSPYRETLFQQQDRTSKHTWKFVGPHRVVHYVHGNKFELVDPNTSVTLAVHNYAPLSQTGEPIASATKPGSHTYNLRRRVWYQFHPTDVAPGSPRSMRGVSAGDVPHPLETKRLDTPFKGILLNWRGLSRTLPLLPSVLHRQHSAVSVTQARIDITLHQSFQK